MKIRFNNRNKFKPKSRRLPVSYRIDPTKTSKLRKELSNHLKGKFSSLKKKLIDLIIAEDAFGLKLYTVNSNEKGCNQYTGPNCSGESSQELTHPYFKHLTDSETGKEQVEIAKLDAKQFRMRNKLPPKEHELKLMLVSDIKPSQTGEDYDNASSRYLSKHIDRFNSTKRLDDYKPIIIDENNNILDGNHRHAAHTFKNIKYIPVLKPIEDTPDKTVTDATQIDHTNEEDKKEKEWKTKLQKIGDKLKAAGINAKHVEEAISSYIKDKVSTNIAKLPEPIQKVVNAGVIAGKVITKTAFVTWISGQALAEQVAKEKGRTEEEAKKLKSTLQALDIAAYKPAQIVSIIGLGPAAAFTSMIPPATAVYLAYSTAKNPLATIRAAKTLVKNLILSLKKKPKEDPPTNNTDTSNIELLDTFLKETNYDDWFIAILIEVSNEMQGDSSEEILNTAKSIYENNPKDNSFLREDDLDYFGKDLTTNRRWSLKRNPEKLKSFQEWLAQQINLTLTSQNEEELWKRFALEGMKKGAARSFDDVKKSAKKKKVYKDWKLQQEYYNGTKEQFLIDSFVQPVATEKLQLLAMRSFDDLWNITDDMSTRMSRTLLDGLATGSSPREIARDLSKDVDISRDRALTVARTEIVRAHADGQLLALKGLGVEELGVAVEWITTGDEKVCKACQPLEGIILKLEEAEGLLPRHPNCRCAWIPANVGEDDEDQISSRGDIKSALEESQEELGGSGWKIPKISRSRPEPILNKMLVDYRNNYAPEVLVLSKQKI